MAVCGGDGGFGFLPAEDARTKARDDWTIYCEIQGIQNAILTSIAECGYGVIVNDNTPMTETNSISSISVENGGSGYYSVTATARFEHPNGSGAAAEVVVMGGQVTQVNVTYGGSGYAPIVALADMTGLGDGAAYVAPDVVDGVIERFQIVSPGAGYSVGDNVAVIHPSGYGVDAKVSQVGGNGNILAIRVDNGGTDYDPIVTEIIIDHPTGGGFVGIVSETSGAIDGVEIVSGGLFYNQVDPEVLIDDISGHNFVGEVITQWGVVTAVNVIDGGSQYSKDAMAIIVPVVGTSGSGAMLEITDDPCELCNSCSSGNCPKYSSYDYYMVYTDMTENRIIEDQIDAVMSYFTKLGYNIKLMTNPSTGDTLQWSVAW